MVNNKKNTPFTVKYPNGEDPTFSDQEFGQIVDLFKLLLKWDLELRATRSSLLTVLFNHKFKLELELERQDLMKRIKEFNKLQKRKSSSRLRVNTLTY